MQIHYLEENLKLDYFFDFKHILHNDIMTFDIIQKPMTK